MRLKRLHDVPVISKQSPDVKEVQESVHSRLKKKVEQHKIFHVVKNIQLMCCST